MYTVHCTLYNAHCTLFTVQYTMYSVHCTMYTVLYTPAPGSLVAYISWREELELLDIDTGQVRVLVPHYVWVSRDTF